MQWIMANIGSLIAGAVVVLILFFVIRSMIRDRKKGSCSCGCSGCSGSCPRSNSSKASRKAPK